MKLPFLKQTSAKDTPVRRRRLRDMPAVDEEVKGQATFRRGNTITGSSSQHIASASELAGQIQSPRAAVHHLHRRRRSFGMLLLGSLGAAAFVLFLMYQMMGTLGVALYGQIRPISTSEQQLYREKIMTYLNRYPLQRLRFLLNKEQLAEYLQAASVGEVKSVVSVQPDSLGAATITVKVREPIASWLIQGTRQYVDADGVVFARNYFDEPDVQIRDESNFTHRDGQQVQAVTSRRFLQFIGQAVSYFATQQRSVKQVIIPASTTRQAIMTLEGGYNIKMTVDRPAGEQAEDALRAVGYFQRKRIVPEYADVRVSGRVFYR